MKQLFASVLMLALLSTAGESRTSVPIDTIAGSATTGPATQAPSKAPAAPAAQPAQGTSSSADEPAVRTSAFSAEQLEQLVAPIALYPDSLLTQVLMTSTYPLEVVEAARWLQKNPKLEGDKLAAALKEKTWDPSVKALCDFPDVVARMNDNLDWTQDLGDAFLGQQAQVMDAVQTMRRKAFDAGQLKSGKEMTVTEQADKIIVIESAQPEVVYVPTYYPSAVYGSWSYPHWHYPPMYPPPPAGGLWFGFTVGVIWGGAWGGCNWGWGHTEIDIDVDHHHEFVDRTETSDRRQAAKDKAGSGKWQHDATHRKGVNYKDPKVAEQYGGGPGQKRVSKDQARGYGDRAATQPGASSRPAAGAGATTRPSGGAGATTGAVGTSRPDGGTTPSQRQASGAGSSKASSTRTGASSGSFTGSRGASLDRASSTRGAASRGMSGARGGGGRGRR